MKEIILFVVIICIFRVFYHTHTCLPMLLHEIDSDEDPVPQWLKITSSKASPALYDKL